MKSNAKKSMVQTGLIDTKHKMMYTFNIAVIIYPENGDYTAYCPSLDLASSGDSYNEALSAFYEAFQLYVEGCIEMGTLQEDLKEHGWKVSKNTLQPPTFTASLRSNKDMKRILDSDINYERVITPVSIPAMI